MTDRPILMSGPMVRACWDGRKTQTRRILKPQPVGDPSIEDGFQASRRFAVGDRLWIRETWQTHCDLDHITPRDLPPDTAVQYPATYDGWMSKRRPGIHMPRWASRMTLAITEVRVQRLQEISAEDAEAEGVPTHVTEQTFRKAYRDDSERDAKRVEYFRELWDRINGPDSWQSDPWVCAVSFTVHRCNIDKTPPSPAIVVK